VAREQGTGKVSKVRINGHQDVEGRLMGYALSAIGGAAFTLASIYLHNRHLRTQQRIIENYRFIPRKGRLYDE
jgi:hypothetical protein